MVKIKQNQKRNSKKVPEFKSVRDEARFWDNHSPLDFPGHFTETKVKVAKPLEHKKIVSVRLDKEILEEINKLAKRKHIGVSTAARMLIAEGLEKATKA